MRIANPPIFDLEFKELRTKMAKSTIKSTIALADKFATDPHKAKRQIRQYCKVCHYVTRMAGQAFTAQACAVCGTVEMYSSTATDVLCTGCAQTHSACKHCSGAMD